MLLAAAARTAAACLPPPSAQGSETAEAERPPPAPTFPAPEIVLVEPPRDIDPQHLCDGFDGFVRVTPRQCWEHGYHRHDGPPPLAVVVVGRPTEGRYPAERLCVLRGRRFAIPAHLTCRAFDEEASHAEPDAVERSVSAGGYAPGQAPTAGGGPVYVHGYTRRDGTYVHGYTRRR